MIKNFASRATEDIFHGLNSKDARNVPLTIWKVACRKLDILNTASTLDDLRVPPGNRLEKLSGFLKGKLSVRVKDQYRIIFKFENGNAFDVEIVDYH